MATNSITSISPGEYLKLDSDAERPSEYLNGKMVQVEAATRNHAAIVTNLSFTIESSLRSKESKCRLYSQLRVHMPKTGLYAYPDLVMACNDETFGPYDTLLNPIHIIEVLSPSTEDYDLGTKFENYRSIPSLKEYWTVAQDRPHIDQWTIVNGHWTLTEHSNLASAIQSGEIYLPLLDAYRSVTF